MKDIMLKIVGKQMNAEAEEDMMEFMTEGKLYKKNGAIYLMYQESELSGMEGCTTSLKIKDGTVRMRRFGENVPIDTVIEFQKGKRFEGFYDTPFGSVELEVLTNEVIDNLIYEDGKGTLNIDYHISLRGLTEGRSRLDIEIISGEN